MKKPFAFTSLIFAAVVYAAPAFSKVPNGNCVSHWKQIQSLELHKAFAATGPVAQFMKRQTTACGGTFGQPSKAVAEALALKNCELVKRKSGIGGKCKVLLSK